MPLRRRQTNHTIDPGTPAFLLEQAVAGSGAGAVRGLERLFYDASSVSFGRARQTNALVFDSVIYIDGVDGSLEALSLSWEDPKKGPTTTRLIDNTPHRVDQTPWGP